MKLSDARICLECDEVFERYHSTDINGKTVGLTYNCPACFSKSTVPLTTWLKPLKLEVRRAVSA